MREEYSTGRTGLCWLRWGGRSMCLMSDVQQYIRRRTTRAQYDHTYIMYQVYMLALIRGFPRRQIIYTIRNWYALAFSRSLYYTMIKPHFYLLIYFFYVLLMSLALSALLTKYTAARIWFLLYAHTRWYIFLYCPKMQQQTPAHTQNAAALSLCKVYLQQQQYPYFLSSAPVYGHYAQYQVHFYDLWYRHAPNVENLTIMVYV